MSTTIEGIFPHALTSYDEIEDLPRRLVPTLAPLCALSYWNWQSELVPKDPKWHVGPYGGPLARLTPRQQWESGTGPMLFAPGETPVDSFGTLLFGRHCIAATTGVKWWAAMEKPQYVNEVRHYFRTLARVLNAHAFILHRENCAASWHWVHQGMNLEQIEAKFIKGGAKRAPDLDTLRHSGSTIEKTAYLYESVG